MQIMADRLRALQDDKTIEAIVSMVMDLQERENTEPLLYEQQLKEAETGINNLLNAIQQGILTPSSLGPHGNVYFGFLEKRDFSFSSFGAGL